MSFHKNRLFRNFCSKSNETRPSPKILLQEIFKVFNVIREYTHHSYWTKNSQHPVCNIEQRPLPPYLCMTCRFRPLHNDYNNNLMKISCIESFFNCSFSVVLRPQMLIINFLLHHGGLISDACVIAAHASLFRLISKGNIKNKSERGRGLDGLVIRRF